MIRPRFAIAACAFIAFAMLGITGPPVESVPDSEGSPAFVPGELLVKFKTRAQSLDLAVAQVELNAQSLRAFHSRAEHWRLGPGVSVEDAVQQLKANPLVEYAEPNYILTADIIGLIAMPAAIWFYYDTMQNF